MISISLLLRKDTAITIPYLRYVPLPLSTADKLCRIIGCEIQGIVEFVDEEQNSRRVMKEPGICGFLYFLNIYMRMEFLF